ncbi:BCCT family transporter [Rubrobacter aplysinae]|uniref:BCCT family transporter n=1 Tax=Rubrobacter aplysinae TaxID=909625 RepID=UPI000AA8CEB0|nr:BCCT family transporter [Rubrobacter aplysinae]
MLRRASAQIGPVFYISVAISILFVIWGVLFTENLSGVFSAALSFLVTNFGWAYTVIITAFLAFLVFLGVSRHGRVRLGGDDERPEFNRLSWFTMLFSAGIGLSFLFWGVAEPASHLGTTPYGLQEPGTAEAANLSMQYTFFNWGLGAWGVYAVLALTIAYFKFRRNNNGMISAAFYPLIGDRVNGPIGKAIDILAIFAVLFGVATALGLGAQQLGGGLSSVFGTPLNYPVQLTIILVLTVAFLISAVTGLSRGIRYLSWINMSLAGLLTLFVFFAGPTLYLLGTFGGGIVSYVTGFIPMTLRASNFEATSWEQSWTLFYWAWWVSWAPFVGTFIARISRGRTIRDFIVGVVVVPTLASFGWFSIYGGTAMNLTRSGEADISGIAANNLPESLFVTLNSLPLGTIISVVALVLVSIFFVTSGDSATFVLGSMSTDGAMEPNIVVKVTWGVIIASFAAVLLLVGGLSALQTATIVAAAPFSLVMVLMGVSLYMMLSREAKEKSSGPVRGGSSQRTSGSPTAAENGNGAHGEREVEESGSETSPVERSGDR